MAQSKGAFAAASMMLSPVFAGLPVTAGSLPPSVPLSAAGPGVMEECRVGIRKLRIPAVLNGGKYVQERALVYYATNSILDTEC